MTDYGDASHWYSRGTDLNDVEHDDWVAELERTRGLEAEVERLLAALERIRAEGEDGERAIRARDVEVERLRAALEVADPENVAKLIKLVHRRDEARAEVERLRAKADADYEALQREYDAAVDPLVAENERLRAELSALREAEGNAA